MYHFTKTPEILVSILKNGFYPRVAVEDLAFMLPNYSTARVGIPMVCFTDIPLTQSTAHREEYGQFGLGMTKEWGIKKGLNPIGYIVKGSEMCHAYNNLQSKVVSLLSGDDEEENTLMLVDAFMNYSGFLKVYSQDHEMQNKPFYDEREWRYLPPFKEDGVGFDGCCNRLTPDIADSTDEKNKLNQKMEKKYVLQFDVQDISQIILPKDYSIFEFQALLQEANLPYSIEEYIGKIKQPISY